MPTGGARPNSGPKYGGAIADVQYLMAHNRVNVLRYLVNGDEWGDKIPAKLKKHLDNLEAASDRGELKATKEILDRVAGRPMQNVNIDVSNRKLIKDDTQTAALPAGSPAARAQYRIIEAQKKHEKHEPKKEKGTT